MSGWNYRVVYHPPSKYKVGDTEFDRDEYLAIHEVYYDDDDRPNAMTVDGIVIGDEGETSLASLRWILEHQLEALSKPILTEEMENGEYYKELSQEKQDEFSKSSESEEPLLSNDSSVTD